MIKGIGPKTAKKIVKMFGKETLNIMQYNPYELTKVEGIGEKKARAIAEAFQEQRQLSEVMLFLQSYGVTPNKAVRIYKKYGENTIQLVQENPYRLADEIFGIGFRVADAIAKRMGLDPCSPYRLMCGIRFVLNQYSLRGHTYVPRQELISGCAALEAEEERIEDALMQLVVENEVHLETIDGEIVVLKFLCFMPKHMYAKDGSADAAAG